MELSYLKQRYLSGPTGFLTETLSNGHNRKDALERLYKLPQMSFVFLWKSALVLLTLFILRLMAARSLYILFASLPG